MGWVTGLFAWCFLSWLDLLYCSGSSFGILTALSWKSYWDLLRKWCAFFRVLCWTRARLAKPFSQCSWLPDAKDRLQHGLAVGLVRERRFCILISEFCSLMWDLFRHICWRLSDVLGASYCDILRLAIAPCFSAPGHFQLILKACEWLYAEICCCTYMRARPIVTECGTFHHSTQIRCPDRDFLFVSCGGLLDFFSLHAFDAQMRYIRYIIFMFYRYSACRIAPVLNSGQFESMLGAYYSYYSNYFVLSTGQGRISGIAAMWTAQAELLRARQAIWFRSTGFGPRIAWPVACVEQCEF